MSTITSSSAASAASATVAADNAALQQAMQSVISGATGNSSLDVNSLVTALVNSKTAGQVAALAAKQSGDNTQISAFGTLSAALGALETGLTSLSNGGLESTFTATMSGGTGITASAGTGAVAGSYSVAVSQVATAQALTSSKFAATQALGSGTLGISLGSKSFNVSIDSSNNTLAGIAAAINGATGNPGVTATVVNGTDGAHLVLASSSTGAASTISVAVSNLSSDNGLSSLGVTSTASTTGGQSTIASANSSNAWTQSTVAQDAAFTVNGIAASSATNAVTSAISGVTLNLTSAAVTTPATTQTLTIAADTTTQANTINNFVSLYNTVVTTMGTLAQYTSGATTQGPLLGDSTLNTIKNSLASIIGGGVKNGSTTNSLGAIGISLQADGTLQVDSTALNKALTSNSATVASLFNSTDGIGAKLSASITNFTQTGGMIDARTSALNADLKSITTQQSSLNDYIAQLTTQYQAQFTALNTLMATTTNNSQYLTQLFGGTNSAGALATNK
ncbi:flagellar filament capping protein FliD [Paraburkholderia phenoliruptrix]|uniref:flagellar filament capping protein FliD n=1 Tax=Paraburkholderia phenoliruptrix TaxID=252970 RepID=UPI0001C01D9A